jgi:hypothetical protein
LTVGDDAAADDFQIFISYARDDNRGPPNRADLKGFVTYLDEQLNYEFTVRGPDRPRLWRDTEEIAASELFDERIRDAIGQSSVFVVVLSPNWISRPQTCGRELAAFAERWKDEGTEGIKHRIVVVGNRFVPREDIPELLQGQVGHLFYEMIKRGDVQKAIEFFSRGKAVDDRCDKSIEELADRLLNLMKRGRALNGRGNARPVAAPPTPNGRTLYLAKPTTDLQPCYNRLVKELLGRGYRLLPDPGASLPEAATPMIDAALAEAELSIHLLGDEAESGDNIAMLQLVRAAQRVTSSRAGEAEFRRIIWAPKDLRMVNGGLALAPERDPQTVLTAYGAQLSTDKVMGDNLSKFVDFLDSNLVRTVVVPQPPEPIAGDTTVYLYYDASDTDYAFKVAKSLHQNQAGIALLWPPSDGPPAELIDAHQKNLRDCDSIVLCWAAAPETWAMSRSNELKDWRKLGRSRMFSSRSVVAGPPPGTGKKMFVELFPRAAIDRVVDLTTVEPTLETLAPLLQNVQQHP